MRALCGFERVEEFARLGLRKFVVDHHNGVQTVLAVRVGRNRAVEVAAGVVDHPLRALDHFEEVAQSRRQRNDLHDVFEDLRRLILVVRGGYNLGVDPSLWPYQVDQNKRRDQRSLSVFPRDRQNGFPRLAPNLPIVVNTAVAIDVIDEVALPRPQSERLAGTEPTRNLEPLDEPDYTLGP